VTRKNFVNLQKFSYATRIATTIRRTGSTKQNGYKRQWKSKKTITITLIAAPGDSVESWKWPDEWSRNGNGMLPRNLVHSTLELTENLSCCLFFFIYYNLNLLKAKTKGYYNWMKMCLYSKAEDVIVARSSLFQIRSGIQVSYTFCICWESISQNISEAVLKIIRFQ